MSASVIARIWKGQTLMRIFMDDAFSSYALFGRVVDVGGGRNPDYFHFFKKEDVSSVEAIDASITGIDFEKDPLPYADNSADTVVCANVLEHIYNHRFLVSEMRRILRPSGKIIGFVPFFIQYHPDPRDYFRYTKDALFKILQEAGFKSADVREVGRGPFTANLNNLILSFPRPLRVLCLYPTLALDALFLRLRSNATERYPLGYIFFAEK